MMFRRSTVIGLLCLLVFSVQGAAFAFWPFNWLASDKPEDYSPPPPDAMKQECDPIRLKIVRMNQKSKFVHPFYRPRIGILKRKYEKCTQKFRDQEYKYLKHAKINRPVEPKPEPSPDLAPLDDPRFKKDAGRGLDPDLFSK